MAKEKVTTEKKNEAVPYRDIVRNIKRNLKGVEALKQLQQSDAIKSAIAELEEKNEKIKTLAMSQLKKELDTLTV